MGRGRSESLAGHLHRESQQMATREERTRIRRDAYTSWGRTGCVRSRPLASDYSSGLPGEHLEDCAGDQIERSAKVTALLHRSPGL